MNIGGLVGALLPVFFVLALGYIAGKRNTFDPDQAAGLSKLALSFALPAALFVRMLIWNVPGVPGLQFRFRNAYVAESSHRVLPAFRIILNYELPLL